MKQTTTAKAAGQRITATATEGQRIIMTESPLAISINDSTNVVINLTVHVDGADLRDLVERIVGELVATK